MHEKKFIFKAISVDTLSKMKINELIRFYGDEPIEAKNASNALRIIATNAKKREFLGLAKPLGYGGFKQIYEYSKKKGMLLR
jgi:hypothetical protein